MPAIEPPRPDVIVKVIVGAKSAHASGARQVTLADRGAVRPRPPVVMVLLDEIAPDDRRRGDVINVPLRSLSWFSAFAAGDVGPVVLDPTTDAPARERLAQDLANAAAAAIERRDTFTEETVFGEAEDHGFEVDTIRNGRTATVRVGLAVAVATFRIAEGDRVRIHPDCIPHGGETGLVMETPPSGRMASPVAHVRLDESQQTPIVLLSDLVRVEGANV